MSIGPTTSPSQPTPQEARDKSPYTAYIEAITQAADAAWPTLDQWHRTFYEVNVYRRLNDARRSLALFHNDAARRYLAAVSISLALDGAKLGARYPKFYADVFASPEFNGSSSAFRGTVVDLWKRYTASKMVVPYTELLLLNQPDMGTPAGQGGDPLLVEIATLYAGLGDHAAEARWYDRVSPVFLGPLRAADARYEAHQYDAAANQYQVVLADVDNWAQLKKTLAARPDQLYEPLRFADLDRIKAHALTRESECRSRSAHATAAATRPS